jgi:hypothetical protein
MSAGVKILDWAERRSDMLRGFVTAEFPSGLIFHQCPLVEKLGLWFVSPPGKPAIGRDGTVLKEASGKTKYAQIVTFADKARRDLWSNTIVEALRAARPEIFE